MKFTMIVIAAMALFMVGFTFQAHATEPCDIEAALKKIRKDFPQANNCKDYPQGTEDACTKCTNLIYAACVQMDMNKPRKDFFSQMEKVANTCGKN